MTQFYHNGTLASGSDTATSLLQPPELPDQGDGGADDVVAKRPIISELDRWAKRNFQKFADELDEDQMRDLATYVTKVASEERQYWDSNKARMREDHNVFALTTPKGVVGHDEKTAEEKQATGVEMVVLPDPYLFGTKVVNVLVNAKFTIRMPSTSVSDMTASQELESALYGWWKTWVTRNMYTRSGAPDRAMFKNATLRGWIVVLTMPDSEDKAWNFDFRVVDPLEIYPCWDHKGLTRVIRQYDLTAAQARRESFLADAEEMYEGYGKDDTMKVIGWYDQIYHFAVVQGRQNGSDPEKFDQKVVKRPVPHGVKDFDGEPQVPWVIVLPNGDLSGGMETDSTTMVGPGILYGMHDVYTERCRLVSMLLTGVALSTNPPLVHYVDNNGLLKSERLNYAPGTENVAMLNREKYEVLKNTPDPQALQPLMQILNDASSKATLPDVFFGNAFSGTSGYAVNLLKGAAQDVLAPYAQGFEAATRLILRRAMEIYYHILRETVGEIPITATVEGQPRPVKGRTFNSELIQKVGVEVDVKFGEVAPSDEAAMAGYLLGLVQAGVLSRYTARDKLGIQDPMAEELKVLRETVLQNPNIAAIIGPMAAEMGDGDILQAAVNFMLQQQQEVQRQQEEMARQQGAAKGIPTQSVPLEQQTGGRAGQAPAAQNPVDEATRQRNAMVASLSGGSPAAPR